jgi:MFS family permease
MESVLSILVGICEALSFLLFGFIADYYGIKHSFILAGMIFIISALPILFMSRPVRMS